MYPMINEGARILEEKIAARPSDIDVVWLYGYGWPIYRGGPMFYADSVGLKHIAERLSVLRQGRPTIPSLEPAPLLKRLADEGKTFASLAQQSQGGLMRRALRRSSAPPLRGGGVGVGGCHKALRLWRTPTPDPLPARGRGRRRSLALTTYS